MRNFQDTFETRNRSFIRAFSICMTVPLRYICLEKLLEVEQILTRFLLGERGGKEDIIVNIQHVSREKEFIFLLNFFLKKI